MVIIFAICPSRSAEIPLISAIAERVRAGGPVFEIESTKSNIGSFF